MSSPADDVAECDGIFADVNSYDAIKVLKATGLPMVSSGNWNDPDVVYVESSPEKTAAMAAEWFIARKFTNLAFIGRYGISSYERIDRAFSDAVAKAGLVLVPFDHDKMSIKAKQEGHSLRQYCAEWVRTLPPRTAVFCDSDDMARVLIESCPRIGRSVPGDVAIMGQGNDSIICLNARISITSIDLDDKFQTYTAMQLLEDMIDHPEKAAEWKPVLTPPLEVVERESTSTYPVDPPWLAKALLLIDANIDRQVSLTELADAADVSQTWLQAKIRSTFGMSANKYILSVKMREAKRLVDGGRHSVKEIAAKTGFSSPSYFSKTYAAFYGHPPTVRE